MRGLALAVALSITLVSSAAALHDVDEPAAEAPRVRVTTSEGSFTVELDAKRAPAHVAGFLSRVGDDVNAPDRYVGSVLCTARADGFLVFGCRPRVRAEARPEPLEPAAPIPDEIDARALGLHTRMLEDRREVDWLWQQEIYPRHRALAESGRPIPEGLAALVGTVRTGGPQAAWRVLGRSRLWLFEQLGFVYRAGASGAAVEPFVLASANVWPGESDARFLVPLTRMSERDGRATVYGRVIEGKDVLDRIARLPSSRARVPRAEVSIVRTERLHDGVGVLGSAE